MDGIEILLKIQRPAKFLKLIHNMEQLVQKLRLICSRKEIQLKVLNQKHSKLISEGKIIIIRHRAVMKI